MKLYGLIISICFISGAAPCLGQSNTQRLSTSDRALQEYKAGQYTAAEQDCRDVVKQEPSNIYAQFYLGQVLFMQKKYAESVAPFERARELETKGMKLSSDQHRILVDQLVIAY